MVNMGDVRFQNRVRSWVRRHRFRLGFGMCDMMRGSEQEKRKAGIGIMVE